MKYCCLAVVLLLLGVVGAQISNSLDFDDIEKQLKDTNLDNLQNKLAENGLTIPELNKTKIDLDKIENVLREKCAKRNASGTIDDLKAQQEVMKECISSQVNATQIQDELDEAKKTGSMDEVFKKYCNLWPDVYACFENTTISMRQCMSPDEEKAFNKSLDITLEFREFMCDKDGDRLAMFVAEGGVECVQDQQQGLKDCFNKTVGARLPDNTDGLSVTTLPVFLFSEKDCKDFDEIRTCVNGVLEQCKDTTPANIVDASLKFLKKHMPCVEGKVAAAETRTAAAASAAGSWVNDGSFVISLAAAVFLRYY